MAKPYRTLTLHPCLRGQISVISLHVVTTQWLVRIPAKELDACVTPGIKQDDIVWDFDVLEELQYN